MFSGISLEVEDLLLLEPFQIAFLPERVPPRDLAAVMRAYPFVKNFLEARNPGVRGFIESSMSAHEEVAGQNMVRKRCDDLLWEIADLIIYNKFPELYDQKVEFNWGIGEIIEPGLLTGKDVADVGAGSGRLAFLLADYAKTVYAVEPISSFRGFMRSKAKTENRTNVFVVDGFLESIPFPDDFLDFLFTANAVGWHIRAELREVERVVKPGGGAIHIMRIQDMRDNPVHDELTSESAGYRFSRLPGGNGKGVKLIYRKTTAKA